MKLFLIVAICLSNILFGQQTITSTHNGLASNPLTWNCYCVPTTDDSVIINHTVLIDVNWAVTNGGSITVNPSGELLQAGLINLVVDGSESVYINHGKSSFDNVAFTNEGSLINDGHFSINNTVHVSWFCNIDNSGLIDGIDSLYNKGVFLNTGTLYLGNLLNDGEFFTIGSLGVDSIGNTAVFMIEGGYVYCNSFGNLGGFQMLGPCFMDVANDLFNNDIFILGPENQIFVHHDLINGDSLSGPAMIINDGLIEVWNNFYNVNGLYGSGKFCIANGSYNYGSMYGIYDFCDNTGGSIDVNNGIVDIEITFCQPGCSVGLTEFGIVNVQVYPNPSEGIFTVNGVADNTEVIVCSLAGQHVSKTNVLNGTFDLTNLPIGTYLIIFADTFNMKPVKINIQK